MLDQFKEIIEKNLPAQVGEVLQKRLIQADKDAKEVEDLKKQLELRNETISNLNKSIQEYQQYDQRNLGLNEREKELDKREHSADLKELAYQLQCEKEKTTHATGVAMGLVRNLDFRKNIFDSETLSPFIDANGQWQYPQPTSKSHTENKTAD